MWHGKCIADKFIVGGEGVLPFSDLQEPSPFPHKGSRLQKQ